jgi:hypothetical protein
MRQAAPAVRIIRRFLRNRKLSPKEVELLNRAYGYALHSLHLVDRDDPIADGREEDHRGRRDRPRSGRSL